LNHGNKEAVKAAPPAIIQVCAPEVVLVHQGDTFRKENVWFYLYEGALPDAMLSDEFLNTIQSTITGKPLLDTRERELEIEMYCVNTSQMLRALWSTTSLRDKDTTSPRLATAPP
jgi:hypothetical protein